MRIYNIINYNLSLAKIAVIDSYPPVKNPSNEIINIIKFLIVTSQLLLVSSHEIMINSMRGGSTNANTVLQTDPIKLSRRSNSGINMATLNVTRTMKVLKMSSPIKGCSLEKLLIFWIFGNII